MDRDRANEKRWLDYAAIVAALAAAHGLLLFSDGVFWDDWLWLSHLQRGDSAQLVSAAIERGVPADAALSVLIAGFSNPLLACHLMVLGALAVAATAIYLILRDYLPIGRPAAVLVSMLSLVYPGFQTWVLMSTSGYVVYYALFLCAVVAALEAERRHGASRYVARSVALVLFLVSFSLNSLLVYYFGFLWALFAYVRRQTGTPPRKLLRPWAWGHLDYVVLPFLYWTLKELLFPRHGVYAGYNRFSASPAGFAVSVSSFLAGGVWDQLDSAFGVFISHPALLVAIIVLGSWLAARLALRTRPVFGGPRPNAMLWFGLALLGLAVFPYAAVGLHAAARGWGTRHTLLLGLPMALLAVGLVRLVFATEVQGLSTGGALLLGALAVGYVGATIDSYLAWEARWAKDRSVVSQLAAAPRYRRFSVILVDDGFPLGGEARYRDYEWAAIFHRAWGDQTHLGIDERDYDPAILKADSAYFNDRYLLADFDPGGCRAVLHIRPGPAGAAGARLALRYLAARFLTPSMLPQLLARTVSLSVQPMQDPDAVHCPVK